MQLFNKVGAKKTLVHTWYIYPLLIASITIMWIWGFQAFHLPSSHQLLVLFFATKVRDKNFSSKIQHTYYKEENLRQVDVFSSLPSANGYYTKLNLYLSEGDILVLDKKTIDEFKGYQHRLFQELNSDFLEKYSLTGYECYTYEDEQGQKYNYGLKIKTKGVEHYLDKYMAFDENYDYYVTLSLGSDNLGYLGGKNNKKYDNALTYMKYLLEANL